MKIKRLSYTAFAGVMAFAVIIGATVTSSNGFFRMMSTASTNDFYHYAGVAATNDEPGIYDYYTNCAGITSLTLPDGANLAGERTLTQNQIDAIFATGNDPRIISPLSHNITHVEGVAAGKTNGVVEHYHCEICGKNYTDLTCRTEIDPVVIPATLTNFNARTAKGMNITGITLDAMKNKTFAMDLKFAADGEFVVNLKDKQSSNEYTLLANTTFTKSGDVVTVNRGGIEKMEGSDGTAGWYTFFINEEEFTGDGYNNSTNFNYFYYRGGDTCTAGLTIDNSSIRLIEKVYKHGKGIEYSSGSPDATFVGSAVGSNELVKLLRVGPKLNQVDAVSFDFKLENSSSARLSARCASTSNWATLVGAIDVTRDSSGNYSCTKGTIKTYADGWANLTINANEFTGDGYGAATNYEFSLMSIRNLGGKITVDFSTIHSCVPVYGHNNTSIRTIAQGTSNADNGSFAGANKNVRVYNLEESDAFAFDMKLDEGASIKFGMKTKGSSENTILSANIYIKKVSGVVTATSTTQGLAVRQLADGWVTIIINSNQFNGNGYPNVTTHPINFFVWRDCTGGSVKVDYTTFRKADVYRGRESINVVHLNSATRYDVKWGGIASTFKGRAVDFATANAISFDIKLDGNGWMSPMLRCNGSQSFLEGGDIKLVKTGDVYSMGTAKGSVVNLENGWARVTVNKTELRQTPLNTVTLCDYITVPNSNTVGYSIDLSSFQVANPHS